jgi:hypothetical protein
MEILQKLSASIPAFPDEVNPIVCRHSWAIYHPQQHPEPKHQASGHV